MKNTAIIIPARLAAKRFPNKPLAKIKNIPMIIHCIRRAEESKVGEVYVATPDMKIFEIVNANGGKAILTKKNHLSGSDRVYEAWLNQFKENVDLIINLQGDMPNIKPKEIYKLEKLMRYNKCDIGTLASNLKDDEFLNPNVVKVCTDKNIKGGDFLDAKDFFRIKKDSNDKKIYHHCGIYIFTKKALFKYTKLPRSKLEIERNLEQMRALENNLVIKVGFCDSAPLGIDTEGDLLKVTKEMC